MLCISLSLTKYTPNMVDEFIPYFNRISNFVNITRISHYKSVLLAVLTVIYFVLIEIYSKIKLILDSELSHLFWTKLSISQLWSDIEYTNTYKVFDPLTYLNRHAPSPYGS